MRRGLGFVAPDINLPPASAAAPSPAIPVRNVRREGPSELPFSTTEFVPPSFFSSMIPRYLLSIRSAKIAHATIHFEYFSAEHCTPRKNTCKRGDFFRAGRRSG